jgi:hypothetical protein
MTYFIYRNPQLETGEANRFPDAIADGFILNIGKPLPNAQDVIWYLAARDVEADAENSIDTEAVIKALPYQTKIIGVDPDNDVEYVAPWLRDWKYKKLGSAADTATKAFIVLVPDFERATWENQEREARAWLADNAADTPTLSIMSLRRGDTVADLVPKVIIAADGFRQLGADNLGKLQALGGLVYTQPLATVMALTWT